MSTHRLVERFYDRIWNAGDYAAIAELLAEDVVFRGSLGAELKGRAAFSEYVRSIHDALRNYRCEILTCVTETDRSFAQTRFSGQHVGPFRGFEPTGKHLHWLGAALFRVRDELIQDVWVVSDLTELDAMLKSNQAA